MQDAAQHRIENGEDADDILHEETALEEQYHSASHALAVAQTAIPTSTPRLSNESKDADTLIILQLSIAPFDGNMEKWEAFRESFVHVIQSVQICQLCRNCST